MALLVVAAGDCRLSTLARRSPDPLRFRGELALADHALLQHVRQLLQRLIGVGGGDRRHRRVSPRTPALSRGEYLLTLRDQCLLGLIDRRAPSGMTYLHRRHVNSNLVVVAAVIAHRNDAASSNIPHVTVR